MTYKYFEEIDNGFRKFNVANCNNSHYQLSEQIMNLRPIYFNQFGNIFYDKNPHNGSDINLYTIKLLKLFITEVKTIISLTESKTNFSELSNNLILDRFKHSSYLSLVDIRPFINCCPEPYESLELFIGVSANIFSEDAMKICNSIKETFYQIASKIYELGGLTNDSNQLLFNILEFFCINIFSIREKIKENNILNDSLYSNAFTLDRYLNNIVSDFLVSYVGLDKIETSVNKTISTTKRNICETFFNYLILDYTIVKINKLLFDANDNSVHYENKYGFDYGTEREFHKEIELIRKLVPYEERFKYFI